MKTSEIYFAKLLVAKKITTDAKTGIVISNLSGHPKKIGAINSAGYLHMSSGPTRQERYHILIHRLIWLSVHGDIPDRYEVNHKNGNKIDNRIDNLELVTRSQNVIHAHYTLGKNFGIWSQKQRFNPHTTTKEHKIKIMDMINSGVTNQSEIARRVGVSRSVVCRVFRSLRSA